MQYTSQDFLLALKTSHEVATKVEAIQNETAQQIDFTDASVVYSLTDSTRSSLDLRIIDYDNRVWAALESLLDPFLTTFRAWRGMKIPSTGATERVLLGHYYPNDVNPHSDESGFPVWSLRCFDQADRAQDDLDIPVAIPGGTPVNDAVQTLLATVRPRMQFDLPHSEFTVGPVLFRPRIDPWAEARRLMQSAGADLFMRRDDVCTSATPVQITGPDLAVWHFEEGVNADFWGPERKQSNDGSFPNVVIVQGTNPAVAGITGMAMVDDPQSKLYVGRFKRVRTFESEYVTTRAQAGAMARYMLAKLLGPQDDVTLHAIPNPALDVGDVVKCTSTSLGLNATLLVVAHIELPLGADGDMTVTCQRDILSDTIAGSPVRQ